MATWGAYPTGSEGASGEVSALRYVSGAVGCAREEGQPRCEQDFYTGDRRKETHDPNGELFLCLVLDFFHVGQVDLAELTPGLVLVARRREGYIVVRGLDGQVGRCWFRIRVGRQRRSDVGALVGDLASEGRVGRAESQTASGRSQSCGKHSVFLSWRSMRRGKSESAGKVGNAKIRSSRSPRQLRLPCTASSQLAREDVNAVRLWSYSRTSYARTSSGASKRRRAVRCSDSCPRRKGSSFDPSSENCAFAHVVRCGNNRRRDGPILRL